MKNQAVFLVKKMQAMRVASRKPHAVTGFTAFSLIELLVVIAIIAILAAVATPVTNKIMAKARVTSCSQQMAALELAIANYQLEYGTIPMWIAGGVPKSIDNALNTVGSLGQPGRDFIECLMGEDTTTFRNPRKITFFEPNYTENGKSGYGTSQLNPSQKGFFDPWGNAFYVTFDFSGDGMVRPVTEATGYSRYYTVQSKGPDGQEHYAFIGGENDDIYSYK
jgi:prepilin-type N-terminal cleavage/methylation domain-containing protein